MSDKKEAMAILAAGLDASIHVMPEIIKVIHSSMPPEHKKVNVVAAILVMTAKQVLEAEGMSEEKQQAFVAAVAKLIVSQPGVLANGVAIVGADEAIDQN